MEKIKISLGKGENLFGFTIPANAVYGKVNNVYYICDNFVPVNVAGTYNIRVYNRDKSRFVYVDSDKFPRIHTLINAHVKNTADLCVIPATHKNRDKRRSFYAKKRSEHAKRRLEIEREMEYYSIAHESAKMRRPPVPNQRAWSQSCVDGHTLNDFHNSAPCAYYDKTNGMPDSVYMNNPAIFQRDGVKHPFNKYRPQDNRPVYSGRAKCEEENGEYVLKYFNPYPNSDSVCRFADNRR